MCMCVPYEGTMYRVVFLFWFQTKHHGKEKGSEEDGKGARESGVFVGEINVGERCLTCKIDLLWECFAAAKVHTWYRSGRGRECDWQSGGQCTECMVEVMWRVFVGEGMWGGIKKRREGVTERQDGRGESGRENWGSMGGGERARVRSGGGRWLSNSGEGW